LKPYDSMCERILNDNRHLVEVRVADRDRAGDQQHVQQDLARERQLQRLAGRHAQAQACKEQRRDAEEDDVLRHPWNELRAVVRNDQDEQQQPERLVEHQHERRDQDEQQQRLRLRPENRPGEAQQQGGEERADDDEDAGCLGVLDAVHGGATT
jgi:hypothetical protein